jgi:hypothetical protein
MLGHKVKAHWSSVLRRVEMQDRAVIVEMGNVRRQAAVVVSNDWFRKAVAAIGEPSGGVEDLEPPADKGSTP